MSVGQLGMKHPSLGGMVDAIKCKISRESLHGRFNVDAVSYLESCMKFVFKKKVKLKALHTKYLKKFNQVLIIDSSSWDINSKLADILPGSGGCASKANCKIQTFYEYKRGDLSFVEITPGVNPDNKYTKEIPDKIRAKDLILMDLGYFCLLTFAKIIEKSAFFISRFNTKTTLWDTVTATVPIDLGKILANLKYNMHVMDVKMGASDNTRVAVRLVCFRVSEEIANQRRMKLEKEAKKKGRTPSSQSLEFAAWSIMITNVPEKWIPSEMLWYVYSLRWQIELIFKQFKSVLSMHRSNTHNVHRLKCEIYGKLIMALLICRIHGGINARLWNSTKRELSFDKLYKRMQERAFHILELLLTSIGRMITYLSKEINQLIGNSMKCKQPSRKSTLQMLHDGFLINVEDAHVIS